MNDATRQTIEHLKGTLLRARLVRIAKTDPMVIRGELLLELMNAGVITRSWQGGTDLVNAKIDELLQAAEASDRNPMTIRVMIAEAAIEYANHKNWTSGIEYADPEEQATVPSDDGLPY
jgi:hypothetical protein